MLRSTLLPALARCGAACRAGPPAHRLQTLARALGPTAARGSSRAGLHPLCLRVRPLSTRPPSPQLRLVSLGRAVDVAARPAGRLLTPGEFFLHTERGFRAVVIQAMPKPGGSVVYDCAVDSRDWEAARSPAEPQRNPAVIHVEAGPHLLPYYSAEELQHPFAPNVFADFASGRYNVQSAS